MFDKLIESAMDFIQVKSSSCEAIRLCHTILKTIISGESLLDKKKWICERILIISSYSPTEKKKNVSYDVNPKSMVQIIRKVLTHASVCPKTVSTSNCYLYSTRIESLFIIHVVDNCCTETGRVSESWIWHRHTDRIICWIDTRAIECGQYQIYRYPFGHHYDVLAMLVDGIRNIGRWAECGVLL